MKALIEAHAFVLSPAKKPAVLNFEQAPEHHRPVSRRGFAQDLWKRMEKKPYPSVEGLRNIQRFMQARNPKVGQIKVQDLIDDSIMRELDRTGYIDRIYAEYGIN